MLKVLKPEYVGINRSIPGSLMPWLLALPGHQQQWHWLYKINRSLFSTKNDFNYPCHLIFGIRKFWKKFVCFLKDSAWQGSEKASEIYQNFDNKTPLVTCPIGKVLFLFYWLSDGNYRSRMGAIGWTYFIWNSVMVSKTMFRYVCLRYCAWDKMTATLQMTFSY